MGAPTKFTDNAAVAARALEVPEAAFSNGMNLGGSNACGIGINIAEGEVVGTPEQFTLLDQHGNARASQISQSIGGYPYADPADWPSSGGTEGTAPDSVIEVATMPTQAAKDADPSLDGSGTTTGGAALADLATGWTSVP